MKTSSGTVQLKRHLKNWQKTIHSLKQFHTAKKEIKAEIEKKIIEIFKENISFRENYSNEKGLIQNDLDKMLSENIKEIFP